jgi:hypothetical protein
LADCLFLFLHLPSRSCCLFNFWSLSGLLGLGM